MSAVRKSDIMQDRTFTAREVLRVLDLSNRAFTNWRLGTPNKEPLPTILVKPGSNRFVISEHALMDWLAKYRPDMLDKWRALCPPS